MSERKDPRPAQFVLSPGQAHAAAVYALHILRSLELEQLPPAKAGGAGGQLCKDPEQADMMR